MVSRVVLLLSAAAAAACSGIVGIPDGRHLADDAGTATLEGGAEASMDAPLDVVNERVDADAGASFDGASDAHDAAGAEAGQGWCGTVTPPPGFCDDFDEGPLSAAWSKQSPGGSVVAVDQAHAESTPSSLHVALSAGGPTSAVTYAVTTFAAAASRIEVTFALWPDTLVPDDLVSYVATIQVGQNTLSLYLNPGKTAWQEHVQEPDGAPPAFPDHNLDAALPTSSWTDVDVVVDLTQSPGRLTVKYDGTAVIASDALDPAWGPGSWSLSLGPVYLNNTTDSRSFHYDDVAVWTSP